jgi:hypothetical protein
MALASTNLTPFCSISKVLDTPASTQTKFYTNQLLHKLAFPHSTFFTNQLLPANHLLHKTPFAPTNFYKPDFTQTSSSTKHILDKLPFTQTIFCTNRFTQPLLVIFQSEPLTFGPNFSSPGGGRGGI